MECAICHTCHGLGTRQSSSCRLSHSLVIRSLSKHDVLWPTLVDHRLYLMESTLSSIKRPIVGLLASKI